VTGGGLRGRLRSGLSRGRVTLAGTVLVLALGAAILVRSFDTDAVIGAAATADPALLSVGLVVYLLSWPIRGRRYGDVLAAMDRRCQTGFLTATVFASQTANLVVPARAGDGVRAYLLNERRDVSYPTGAASLAVERAFDLVAIGALGGGALGVLLLTGRSPVSGQSVGAVGPSTALAAAAGIAVVAAVLSAATVAVARSDRRFAPALRTRVERPRLRRGVDAAIRFGASVRVVAADPRRLGAVFLWSVTVWALDVLTAVFVLAALVGGAVPTPTLLVVGTLAVSVGNLAKVLPLSQGGIGLYEAAFTALVVSATGLPVETALAAAILDHALKNAVTLAGGGFAALALGLSPTAGPPAGGETAGAPAGDGEATGAPADDGESTPSVTADGGRVVGDGTRGDGTRGAVDAPGSERTTGKATDESEASHRGSSDF
jgi:uncharacterized protein (TIRG00374 family)